MKYATQAHQKLPHVINVSGGRSSAMMMMKLLNEGTLHADRGDVVLFNNTSAEHPATYRWLERLTNICETYGIPFYWTEFCTYEDKIKGTNEYTRKNAYRLVDSVPYHPTDAPNGYHSKGEVFEEMVSVRAHLPNRFSRTCTAYMKVGVSVNFLHDWLNDSPHITRLGHHGNAAKITIDDWYDKHLSYGGKLSKDEVATKREFINQCPFFRPMQRFDQFSSVGKKHHVKDGGDSYLRLVGIRADEQPRILRMKMSKKQHPGHLYLPLVDWSITKQDVIAYWAGAGRIDCDLPTDTQKSNCVYCFMKGPRVLGELAKGDGGRADTPNDLGWWIALENRYKRYFDKKTFDHIDKAGYGFFGEHLLDDPNRNDYTTIGKSIPDADLGEMPCECVD